MVMGGVVVVEDFLTLGTDAGIRLAWIWRVSSYSTWKIPNPGWSRAERHEWDVGPNRTACIS